MKRTLPPILALLFMSCANEGPEFVIKGEFDGLKESELLIYNHDSGHETIDTVSVKDGEFAYGGSTKELTTFYLVFPNGMEQVIFVNGGDKLTYKAKSTDLRNYSVEGNEENEEVRAFHQEINTLAGGAARQRAAQHIKENPQSAVSRYIFNRFFVQDEKADSSTTAEVLSVLETAHPQDLSLLAVKTKLAQQGRGAQGMVLPDLKVETKKGDSINIGKMAEPHTLFFYWASWMQSPYDALDLMREIREDYPDSTLGIVSVSADTKKYRWQEYSRQDSVGIYNCCDLKCWDSPLLRSLGVHRLPAYIIADSEHKIVSRSYDTSTLKAEIKRLVRK